MPYKRVPLLRGFTEIQTLFEIAKQFDATICGGYARFCASPRRSDKVVPATDVDIFPHNKDAAARILDCLKSLGFEISHESVTSITLKASKKSEDIKHIPTPQVIKPIVRGDIVTIGTVEEILDHFDFTVARAAIVSPTEVLVDDDFMEDEKVGSLRIKTIKCPVSTTLRCCKYVQKGYVLESSEALKLFTDWSNRSDKDRKEISKHFTPALVGKGVGKKKTTWKWGQSS